MTWLVDNFRSTPPAMLTWQGDAAWPALALAALIVGGVLLFYPRQVRALPGVWRWALPALRALALGALALSVLKPVVLRAKTTPEQGAVLVLLDRSRSMGVKDLSAETDAGKAQLVALADALGRLEPNTRSSVAELDELARRLVLLTEEATNLKNELDFARISGRGTEEPQARLDQALGALLSAAAAARAKAVEQGSPVAGDLANLLKRLERSRAMPDLPRLRDETSAIRQRTLDSQTAFDLRLYQRNDKVRAACQDLLPLSRFERGRRAIFDPQRGLLGRLDRNTPVTVWSFADDLAPLTADGDVDGTTPISDLGGAIRRAITAAGSSPVQAIVLVSDGRQNALDRAPEPIAGAIPVYAVSAGAPVARDLAIASVRMPRAAFVGETILIRVDLRSSGIAPEEIVGAAALTIEGRDPIERPLVARRDRIDPLEFEVRLDTASVTSIEIILPELRGEATFENNRVHRRIKVAAQKLKVALLSASPGWDWRYLRNALERTDWVELHQELLEAEERLSLGPRQILSRDALVLIDVPPAAMDAAQRRAVTELAWGRGGGVVLVAQGRFPADEWAADPALGSLLPWAQGRPSWRTWPGEEPRYQLQLAPEAANADAIKLDADPEANRRRLAALPAVFRYLAMPPLRPSARALLVERQSLSPVLTQMRLGRGWTYLLGLGETWRWRAKLGERDQDAFWRQLARAAAPPPYLATDGYFSLDLDEVTARPGQPVHARFRIGDDELRGLDALTLQVVDDTGVVRAQTLQPLGQGAGAQYEATIPGLPAGQYTVQYASSDTGPPEVAVPLLVAQDTEAEMADVSPDENTLKALAQSSGGKWLGLADIASIPQLLSESASRRPQLAEVPLWDSAYLYGFVVACLCIEWALRKRAGLV